MANLPAFMVVPADKAAALGLQSTAVVEGAVNGHPIGRRSIKRWNSAEDSAWFVEFTTTFCKQASLKVGDALNVLLWLADPALPDELERALKQTAGARATWNALSEGVRRSNVEHVFAAKSRATRSRRAAAIVARLCKAHAPTKSCA